MSRPLNLVGSDFCYLFVFYNFFNLYKLVPSPVSYKGSNISVSARLAPHNGVLKQCSSWKHQIQKLNYLAEYSLR